MLIRRTSVGEPISSGRFLSRSVQHSTVRRSLIIVALKAMMCMKFGLKGCEICVIANCRRGGICRDRRVGRIIKEKDSGYGRDENAK